MALSTFLQNLFNIFISWFHYSIGLGTVRRGLVFLDAIFLEKLQNFILKKGTIILNDLMWNSVPADNVLTNELGYFLQIPYLE